MVQITPFEDDNPVRTKTQPHSRHAVAYYRVSTAEQGHSGLGLEAQQASVRAFVSAQGWNLIGEFSDIASGKDDCGLKPEVAHAQSRETILPNGPKSIKPLLLVLGNPLLCVGHAQWGLAVVNQSLCI